MILTWATLSLSLVCFFVLSQIIKTQRPRTSQGLYDIPFYGFGDTIYASRTDYAILVGSSVTLATSMIALNYLYRLRTRK